MEIYQGLVGSQRALSKLTEDDVRAIRQIHADKKAAIDKLNASCSVSALAEKFGVHRCTIEKVLRYQTWRHVRD